MNNLPCILFGRDAEIIYSAFHTSENTRELFLRSMRRSDRLRFIEFCASRFDPDHPGYCFYEMDGFPDAEYVFIEKDVLRSEEVTIAYFARDPSEFYQLMSPSSAYYRDITGKLISDILRAGDELNLSPGGYLTIDSIPHLRRELTADTKPVEFCCIPAAAEKIVGAFREIPAFSQIRLICPEDESDLILAFPLSSYVFLFTALVCILHTLADDHVITITMIPQENKACTDFGISVSVSRSKEIDSSSLAVLSELSPSTEVLAKIASVIAFNAGFGTSVICGGAGLTAQVTIRDAGIDEPQFHYRDPYSEIPDMVREYLRFFGDILASSGDKTEGEN